MPPTSGSGLQPVAGGGFAEIPLDSDQPEPAPAAQVFDEEALDELVHSIQEVGAAAAGRRPPARRAQDAMRYELIMGERRWRAAREAGFDAIPAIVRETDDDDLLRDALLENLHRSQLNPLEEAAAYDQLLAGLRLHPRRAGRPDRPVPPADLQHPAAAEAAAARCSAGSLPACCRAGHARALLGLDDAAAQERLAQRIVAEGLSVRTVEEIVALGGDEAPATRRAPRRRHRPAAARRPGRPACPTASRRGSIDLGQRKGRLMVEFASIDDLERILDAMHLREHHED